jgi:hypothetical protein
MIHKLTAAVLLACYGGAALVGPELHSLLGCEHDHSAVDRGGDSESSASEKPSFAAGQHGHGAGHDGHDCPVCKLLAMPQSAAAVMAKDSVVGSAFHRVIFSSGPVLAAPLGSLQIRGPPADRQSAATSCS